eukprot:1709409-Rhodomonas_salina.1
MSSYGCCGRSYRKAEKGVFSCTTPRSIIDNASSSDVKLVKKWKRGEGKQQRANANNSQKYPPPIVAKFRPLTLTCFTY